MKNALAKTARTVSASLAFSLAAETTARQGGLFQRLDARTKLLSVLALVLTANLVHQPVVLVFLYAAILPLAAASRIRVRTLARFWLGIPLVAALIGVPALFITPGPTLYRLTGGLAISATGLRSVTLLYLRVGTSASSAILLALTTRWHDLLHALARLGMPDVLLLALGMTYRYIYTLLELTNDMLTARLSRSVGPLSASKQRQVQGALAGTLLARSLDMSGEVYLAMRSRGFSGRARTLQRGRLQWLDLVWGVGLLVGCTLALWMGR
ncbi:MAG: cobalt ECF transporter T component CbiQ [Chloroflexi bacterium]|nr:cobalt ECF transporter T component CbiQ [Chloroflexota bacterium]